MTVYNIENLQTMPLSAAILDAGSKIFNFPLGKGTRIVKWRTAIEGRYTPAEADSWSIMSSINEITSAGTMLEKSVLTNDFFRISVVGGAEMFIGYETALKNVSYDFENEPVFLTEDNFYIAVLNNSGLTMNITVYVIFDTKTKKR